MTTQILGLPMRFVHSSPGATLSRDPWRGVLIVVLAVVVHVDADIVKEFQFDTDGVLPSADPDVIFHMDVGVNEQDVYAVSGGVLR